MERNLLRIEVVGGGLGRAGDNYLGQIIVMGLSQVCNIILFVVRLR